jgi:hypothetical protein
MFVIVAEHGYLFSKFGCGLFAGIDGAATGVGS